MNTIGDVAEIIELKKHLKDLKKRDLIKDWELPYENLLTRLSAVVLFISISNDTEESKVWSEMKNYPNIKIFKNDEKKLSQLEFRVEFKEGIL